MSRYLATPLFLSSFLLFASLDAQQVAGTRSADAGGDRPAQLTVYNGGFAVARTSLSLNLAAGITEVLTTQVTSKLEPDSVVLRDTTGRHAFRILEQNYDAAVVNQQWLLGKYEGKVLDFQVSGPFTAVTNSGEVKTAPAQIVQGRVVRAGHDPLIEVNGRMQFQLPGTPLFPATTDGLLLKPTLRWQIESEKPQRFDAELDYITGGMQWQATYNVVVPEQANLGETEKADVLGWVTVENSSGTDFPEATLQLMAGDVAKIPPGYAEAKLMRQRQAVMVAEAPTPLVTQKAFDDFHLYDLHRTVSLRDGESKQVQFLEAAAVSVARRYVYNGNQEADPGSDVNEDRAFDNEGPRTVAIEEEFENSEANHLGMPLPAGRLRLYRRETSGQMQFVGESEIEHTPALQKVHVSSGNAFDLTGERRQTSFSIDKRAHTLDESFEIKLFNAKEQAVTVHAIEHLNRARNWKITAKSLPYTQRNSATLDFPVRVPAKGSAVVNYTVHYSW